MSRYTTTTPEDLREMLAEIGVVSIDDLFAEIPQDVRLDRPLDLPAGRSELEVFAHLRDLAARNVSTEDEVTFLGAGMYDHYVPAVVDMLTERSEFLTPYTPYQPEVSQGGLQVMFEYQTAISELTGLPVSNASAYEGPSAVGAAGYLAKLANGRRRFVTSRGLHPHSRETLATMSRGYGTEVTEVGLADGVTDPAAWAQSLDDDVSAVFLAQPNFLGAVEDLQPLIDAARERGAVVVCSCDPIPLGIVKPPGELGVDVAVGEGQTLGNRLDFGGPVVRVLRRHRGLPPAHAGAHRRSDHRRGRPPRLRAHAADARAAHPPREGHLEHLHRSGPERAGRGRLPRLARAPRPGRAGRAAAGRAPPTRATRWSRSTGCEPLHEQPVVREFAVRLDVGGPSGPTDAVRRVIERCQRAGVNPGYALGRDYPEYPDGLLVAHHRAPLARRHRPPGRRPRRGGGRRARAPSRRRGHRGGGLVTFDSADSDPPERDPTGAALGDNALHGDPGIERRPPAQGRGAALAETPMQAEHAVTIFEKGRPGRRAFTAPPFDVPERPAEELLPAHLRRTAPGAAARGVRARARTPLRAPVAAQLRPGLRLLSAGLVHDEAQPAAARARRRAARSRAAASRSRTRATPRERWS